MSDLSKQYHSIFIGEKNTWDDWHIVPTSRPLVNPPEVVTEYVDIPGADGSLDYTEALAGRPVYRNRKGSWEFIVLNGYQDWSTLYNYLLTYLHGKTFTIILEDEPEYRYNGRLSLNEWRSEEHNSKVVIDYVISPYKSFSSLDAADWKWDDLTFLSDSYIIYYGMFDVNGKRERNLYNPTNNTVSLSLTLTSDMTVFWYGNTYNFQAGAIPDTKIKVYPGDNFFTFNGSGRVTVSYDRGNMI